MLTDDPASPLLNLSQFAARMKVTRQTVHNWRLAGTCPVAPIVGSKPPKWKKTEVDAFCGDAE